MAASPTKLADALEIKYQKQALNKYEMGQMNPSGDVLVALSKHSEG